MDISEKQEQLVDKNRELINQRVDKEQKGLEFTKFDGSLFENSLRKIIQEEIKDTNMNAEKCFVKDTSDKFIEFDIVIYKKGEEEKELLEKFNTPVIVPQNVLSIVEVKAYADSSGYTRFAKSLKECGLDTKGYFIGIFGSIKDVKGSDLKRQIFIFARCSQAANMKKKQKIDKDKVKPWPGVLEQFLKTLRDNLEISPKQVS
jgi:hypothetical protein